MMRFCVLTIVLLYYLVHIVYYKSLFPVPGRRIPQVVLILLLVAASYLCLNALGLLLLNFPSVMLIITVGLCLCTGMNWKQSIYGGGTCAITAYCFRGAFTSIIGLLYQGGDFLFDANAYYYITLLALPASLLFLWILRRMLLPDDRMRNFLNNNSQLKVVIIFQLMAVMNLTVIHSGRSRISDSDWYLEIALGACLLTLFTLIFATYHSIRSAELLKYQWNAAIMEQQYERQLQHYQSYQKYTESFRAFRHDFQFMMATVKTFLKANDIEKAVQLLDELYDDMAKRVQIHKKYSNHIALDAMLQDLANTCETKGIRLSIQVFAPKDTALTLLDATRIFSNLTNNAIEACEKVPPSDRFIKITSIKLPQWVALEIANSYDGKVLAENGVLKTSKFDTINHGLGFGIVREIAERLGGFVIYDTDSVRKTFLVRIHVPRLQDAP